MAFINSNNHGKEVIRMVSAVAWANFRRADTVSRAYGYGPFDFEAFYAKLVEAPLTKHRPFGAGKKVAAELAKLSPEEVKQVVAALR